MSEYKERIWALVVAHGGVIAREDDGGYPLREYVDYYGSCIAADYDASLVAHAALTSGEVDWERTEDPVQDFAFGFADTFADEQNTIHFLHGLLWTKAGEAYEFAASIGGDMSFTDILKLVLANPPTFEQAVEMLDAHLGTAREHGKALSAHGGDEAQQLRHAQDLFKHILH